MQIGICSYSFHKALAAGQQDIFKYITDCRELGCSQLDPWNAHLAVMKAGDAAVKPGTQSHLSKDEEEYIASVKEAADAAGLPFGLLAVDGAHMYEADVQKRKENRARSHRWLDAARRLGARQMRIDSGGPEEMKGDVFKIIEEGYNDLIARATHYNIEIVVENHWGPTIIPDNVLKLVESINGLGLLLDTHNWKAGLEKEGRQSCAKYATAVHLKILNWDDEGRNTEEELRSNVRMLTEAGYSGCWGIESCPSDGDEYGSVRRGIEVLKKCA